MIGVDRSGGLRSLMEMARRAPKEIRSGRQLIIFPEGTRTPVGAPPNYMTGVGQIYANSGVPCLPVALNSGLFWPRRTFMRYPGTLVVEFLDPLPAGLNAQGIHRADLDRDRGRHQPAGRGGAAGAGAIVRSGAERAVREEVASLSSLLPLWENGALCNRLR